MSEWKERRLDELVKFQRGHDLTQLEMIKGEYPVAGSNGIIDYHNQFTTKGPGITLGRSGNSIGTPHFYKCNFWAHNTTLYSKEFVDAFPLFVFYFLKTIDFKTLNSGSAVPSLNRNHIHNIKIKVPPLSEQKAIASVLSSLDDKIDLLQRQNETLEQLAEIIFRQWFVEEAQDDWEKKKLDDILTVKGGTTPSTSNPDFWNGDIHWTSPKDITTLNGLFLFDTERKITQEGLRQVSSGLLPKGTLLMSSRAPVGVLAFAEIPIAINQGYIAILDDKGFDKHFIYMWLKVNMDIIHSYSNGSTFMEISKSSFKSIDISIPPFSWVENYCNTIQPFFEKVKKNEEAIRQIQQTRDTLQPKLMSGEVRVKH